MANSGVLVRCVCEFPRYYSNWIMKLGVTVVSSSLFVCLFVCLCFPFFSALSILWCSWACPPPFFSNTAFILGNWCSQTRLPNTGSSAYSTCSIEFSNRGGRARHWNATINHHHTRKYEFCDIFYSISVHFWDNSKISIHSIIIWWLHVTWLWSGVVGHWKLGLAHRKRDTCVFLNPKTSVEAWNIV